MKIEQQAGSCRIEVYTDGSPLWPEVSIIGANGSENVSRVRVKDLHDLRYCIDRVLAQIENGRG